METMQKGSHVGGASAQLLAKPSEKTGIAIEIKRVVGTDDKFSARLFDDAMGLLENSFPKSEIESPKQYQDYFTDENHDKWFFDVALDKITKKVVGVNFYSFYPETGVIMYNICAVDKGYWRQGVATKLVQNMITSAEDIAKETGVKVKYLFAEIEQPGGPSGDVKDELLNKIRPSFHDNVSKVRAILNQETGKVVKYTLPIMASNEERREASEAGSPLEEEELLFTMRKMTGLGRYTSMQEAARCLYWFYKDYLGGECSDVKPEDVNRLLGKALTELSGVSITAEDVKNLTEKEILTSLPDKQLKLIKIAESRGK
jgi:GNAT superfamily N-acetyltransferase